jgi:TldD protein
VRTGATAVALSTLPGKLAWGAPSPTSDHARLDAIAFRADPEQMRSLALRAVDAAKAAGATYADVRLTRVVSQSFNHAPNRLVNAEVRDNEELGFGVRALVDGYWGFAASPYWNVDEVSALVNEAVQQAKVNAAAGPRNLEWETLPAATGEWTTPGIDPFTITIEEKLDFLNGWRVGVVDTYQPGIVVRLGRTQIGFIREERFVASTEGTATFQVFYTVNGSFPISISPNDWRAERDGKGADVGASGLQMRQGGWNVVLEAKIRDQIPGLIEYGRELMMIPRKPVDIGRYDVVFDAMSTAELVGRTIGTATQLDLALGFEANAGGTSYLGPDPLELLGTSTVAAPMVTITANRSAPGGCATVKWDDEGVSPEEFTLVNNGVLVDYQTTRELAGWLKPWYEKQQRPVRSHGCAASSSALHNVIQQPPNLALTPSTTAASFETLVSGVSKGLAIMNASTFMDFQAKNGTGGGLVREIVNGKLGKICTNAGFLFGSLELWKNVSAIGDTSSVQTRTLANYKGQPGQQSVFSVSAVPMAVKNVSIIDLSRRA